MRVDTDHEFEDSPGTRSLSRCPRCDQALKSSAQRCSACDYTEIENIDFLDVFDQREYRQKLQFQRIAWTEFNKALNQKLTELGESWRKLEKWNELWDYVRSRAQAAGVDKAFTIARANALLAKRLEVNGNERTVSASPHLEAVRDWVAGLPDGEVNVVLWLALLHSLDGPIDEEFLERFRDAEIRRQFAQFETVRIDSLGNLGKREQKRVARWVENLGDGCELVMLSIPRGRFQMGSDRYRWELPIHSVDVPGFYLGQFPVTQMQWRTVAQWPKVDIEIKEDVSAFKGDNLPVDSVGWIEAAEFCARLQKQTGKQYRLPSEAEWEYACRAGSRTEFAFGDSLSAQIVNYDQTHCNATNGSAVSNRSTIPVGAFGIANSFGLYDMHGNVCEWCADEWHDNYEHAPVNGEAWSSPGSVAQRVVRGGSWTDIAEICRSSDRWRESSDLKTRLHYMGFRVALTL